MEHIVVPWIVMTLASLGAIVAIVALAVLGAIVAIVAFATEPVVAAEALAGRKVDNCP